MLPITIRFAGDGDRQAVDRLAQLDSHAPPRGDLVLAEVGGELQAAIPVGGGEPIADPFRRTADLTALLSDYAARVRRA